MAVLAKTTLLFSKAGQKDTYLNDTFSSLDGALDSSGRLKGTRTPLSPSNKVQAARWLQ